MVSRGGRSKGCSNCRRRRVKCDEKRPVCSQCVKRKLQCDGPKDFTWIDQSEAYKSEQVPNTAVIKTAIPLQLSSKAFEADICLAYTRKNLLRGGPVELACTMVEHYQASATNADPGLTLLRKSILSLSVTFFGSQHRQNDIMNKGYHQYGEVLRQLNAHLARPELQKTNETLLTALSCMLLEIFLPTGPTNFLRHQRGLDALAMVRGPPVEVDRPTATIFHGLRILSIVGALAESRPTLYATEEWKQVPPIQASEAGILQHHIFTVLADCTELISRRNALFALEAGTESYGPFLKKVDDVLGNLEALFPLWESLNRHQLAEVAEQSDMAKEIGVSNHVSATAYMLYNTAYICILQITDSLFPSPANVVLQNEAAMKIAKCLELKEYELREDASQSNTIAFVATKVAWQALGRFDSPGGRKLAYVVKSTMNSVFQEPCIQPDTTLFTQLMETVPVDRPSNTGVPGGLG
ncbi:hypothetical protein BDW02DRAFT_597917 [Decorospora gaudefroyi]|uniref:Zn(2)-C6 fungal-type domain-containing protein n=1 Tax=Decorospora gaudefroyi TaxID=184978 RepID=A0A6A5KFX9_9PLEO|nr:hypothetical protein BDW02DRAFT_597917 [Decorospora gaudefroyi]